MRFLPTEILQYILNFCDPVVCAFVCREWRETVQKSKPQKSKPQMEWCKMLVENQYFEVLEWALSQGAMYVGCWCVVRGVWSAQLINFLMQYKITPSRIQKMLFMTMNVDFAFIASGAVSSGNLEMLYWLDAHNMLRGYKSEILHHATKLDRPDIINWYHYERHHHGYTKHDLRCAIRDNRINIVKWVVQQRQEFGWGPNFWRRTIEWAEQHGKNEIASYFRTMELC